MSPRLLFLAVCAIPSLALVPLPSTSSPTTDDASAIIQRSVQANEADWRALANFDYDEEDRDSSGNSKTYREFMIEGSRYACLIAINDRPLPPSEQAQEQDKLAKAIYDRKHETPDRRRKRLEAYRKERERDSTLLKQLSLGFNFSLKGEGKLGSYDVYILDANPRPGYQPPNMDAQVLTGMKGSLWIDKKSGQWVKVEAEVIHPVTIGGFLARVQPGTQFELEKMPVQNNYWFPKHFSMHSHSRILFLIAHHTQEDETYTNYSPVQYH